MKGIIIITILFFNIIQLYSQFKKGESFLSISGMYSRGTTESGVNFNTTFVKGEYINSGMSLSAVISDCFLIGAGLDYNNKNEIRNSNLLITDKYFQAEEMNLNSSILVPNIYVGYYYGITRELYFNTNLKLRFGENTIKVNGQQELTTLLNTSSDINIYPEKLITTYKYKTKGNYFSTSILPEFTYFVTNKIGLTLGIGGIEYALTKWDTKNSTFVLNFNPNNWQVGLKMQF